MGIELDPLHQSEDLRGGEHMLSHVDDKVADRMGSEMATLFGTG